jgi:Holliday junction DNA helicase RuvA
LFYSITGEIVLANENSVVLDCNGVGFYCSTTFTTFRQLGPVGSHVTLFTHLNVREDALDLFAFYDKEELNCFKLLISVTGVGPKAALAILSQLKPEKLAVCIATADIKTITAAQGVGPKLAQRVVMELKDKMKPSLNGGTIDGDTLAGIASEAGPSAEAVSALVMLGYSRSEAGVAVSKLDGGLTTEQMIRLALKMLAKQ